MDVSSCILYLLYTCRYNVHMCVYMFTHNSACIGTSSCGVLVCWCIHNVCICVCLRMFGYSLNVSCCPELQLCVATHSCLHCVFSGALCTTCTECERLVSHSQI